MKSPVRTITWSILIDFDNGIRAEMAPTDLEWTLEGRNGGQWQALDTRTAQDFPWTRQLRPFRIAQPGAHQEYRLRFAGNTTAQELSELELLHVRTRLATINPQKLL